MEKEMKYVTSLRPDALHRLKKIGSADLLVGIPSLNCEETIANVIDKVSKGLSDHYGDRDSVIFVSDGGSTDDSREIARGEMIEPWQEKIVSIFRGPGGKGSAVRQVCEAADFLGVQAVALVDSDLRNITPLWVKTLMDPVLAGQADFVTPYYQRHKWDGTITNHVAYPVVRALYGMDVRQQIGGEFCFSRELASYYISQDVWTTDVARFGIDVWLTVNALVRGVSICQADLGVKIHDPKDPGQTLGPMFREVTSSLSMVVAHTSDTWLDIEGSTQVPIHGEPVEQEPPSIEVDQRLLIEKFRNGAFNFRSLWEEVYSSDIHSALDPLLDAKPEEFHMKPDIWIRILYETIAALNRWESDQFKLVNLMTPLYFARVASWINETREMDSQQAERRVRDLADQFVRNKPFLVELWKRSEQQKDVLWSELVQSM